MYTNKLKLNDDKSEFVVLGSCAQVNKTSVGSVVVDNDLWVLLLLTMILSKSQTK